MNYVIEKSTSKFFIGLAVKTSNERFQKEALPLWDRFFRENIAEKIPNKLGGNVVVVYTDYDGDYTQPFTYLISCEVSNLNEIPQGMRGVEVSASECAVFTTQGEYPQSLIQTWQTIWKTDIKRLYTSDLEVYPSDFHLQKTPAVKVYIGIE
jgi:predicted transcriptional regulator YdeE